MEVDVMANLINESSRMVVIGVLALGLVGGLFLLLNPTEGDENRMTTTVTTDPVAETTIPPIDATAPTEVETATFALG
jgi:hypothetical protein